MLELPLDPVIMVKRDEKQILAYNIDMDNLVQFVLPLNYETYILYQQMVINYYKKKHQHSETELANLKVLYQTIQNEYKKSEYQCKSYLAYNQVLIERNQELRTLVDTIQKEKRDEESVVKVSEEEIIPNKIIRLVKYENFLNQIHTRVRQTSHYIKDSSKIICFDRVLQKLNSFVNQYIFEEYKIRLDTGFFFRIFFKKENIYVDSIYYTKSYSWTGDSYFHYLEHFIRNESDRLFYLQEVMRERIKRKSEDQIFTKFLYRAVHLSNTELHHIWIVVFEYFTSQTTYEVFMEDNEKYKHLIVFYPDEKEKRPLFMMNFDKERNRDVSKYHDLLMIWF